MPEKELIETLLTTGGAGAAGLVAITMAIRKIWRSYSSESVATTEDVAKIGLIHSLTEDVERIKQELTEVKAQHKKDISEIKETHRADMQAMKDSHKEEQKELNGKLKDIHVQYEALKNKHERLKTSALNVYTYISDNPAYHEIEHFAELKKGLLDLIIKDEEVQNL